MASSLTEAMDIISAASPTESCRGHIQKESAVIFARRRGAISMANDSCLNTAAPAAGPAVDALDGASDFRHAISATIIKPAAYFTAAAS